MNGANPTRREPRLRPPRPDARLLVPDHPGEGDNGAPHSERYAVATRAWVPDV